MENNYSLQRLIDNIYEIGEQFHPDSMEADFVRISYTALGMLEQYINEKK